jgi:hypothetical protein
MKFVLLSAPAALALACTGTAFAGLPTLNYTSVSQTFDGSMEGGNDFGGPFESDFFNFQENTPTDVNETLVASIAPPNVGSASLTGTLVTAFTPTSLSVDITQSVAGMGFGSSAESFSYEGEADVNVLFSVSEPTEVEWSAGVTSFFKIDDIRFKPLDAQAIFVINGNGSSFGSAVLAPGDYEIIVRSTIMEEALGDFGPFDFDTVVSDLFLDLTVVPTPGAAAVLGGIGLLGFRRRR